MANYRLSNDAKTDLIKIHQFGVQKFGVRQAEKYFNDFFECFKIIAQRPNAFESVGYIRQGYRRCPCGTDSIYYRVVDDMVEIMAIIGKQDLNNIF